MMEQELINSVWPEWKIVRQIGRGSFGRVYEAVRNDYQVESRAAIKVISIPQNEGELYSLRSEGLNDNAARTYMWEEVNDFVKEIQLMEEFKGVQNIVSVEDYKVVEKTDEIGWDIYIRMELLTPLATYYADKTMTESEVARLGCDICTALEICSSRNVIHRDIKPDNIFVNDFGHFKLGDFGIARKLEQMTRGLSRKGTLNYMAPEVIREQNYDATVDLYSLGLVLYFLLNKHRLPFMDVTSRWVKREDKEQAYQRRLEGEPLPWPCDASQQMAGVILCACAYDPKRRFATPTAMKNALQGVIAKNESQNLQPQSVTAYENNQIKVKLPEQNKEPDDDRDREIDTDEDEDFTDEEVWIKHRSKKENNREAKDSQKNRKRQDNRKKPVGLIAACIVAAVIVLGGYGVYKIRDLRLDRYNSLVEEQIASREDSEAEEAAYESAVRLYPSGLESYYQHAAALYEYAQDPTNEDYDYIDCITFINYYILQNDEIDLTQERMADVYALYADCYLAQEDYSSAASAYESLFKIGADEVLYYRNYAIALAGSGDVTKAEKILQEAEELGLADDGVYYTEGEIEMADGDDAAALEDFENCIQVSSDEDLLAGAYQRCASIYSDSESGEYDLKKARKVLLEALDKLSSDNLKLAQLMQKLIDTDMKLADLYADIAGEASVYRQEAIENLLLVEENGWATFNTYNNLVILYQKEKNLESAEEILKEIEADYSEDYRWYKRYAFLEIAKQQELDTDEQDYTAFAEYYMEAEALYEAYQSDGSASDGEMGTLETQYENVERAGWLS